MVLLTVEELQAKAVHKDDIDITDYSDDEIQDLINEAQSVIKEQTGRIFDSQTFTEKHSGADLKGGNALFLKHSPIISIEELTIDGNVKTENTDFYVTKPEIGLIKTPIGLPETGYNNIIIEYTAGYEPPHPPAVRLAIDFVLNCIKYDLSPLQVQSNLSSIKEGDVTLNFQGQDKFMSIDGRINSLKRYAAGMI